MFTQPPFPSAGALKAADAAQTARLPQGTRNVHTFSTEPRYSPLPIRFKVRGNVFENNYTTVNLGGQHVLPPVGGLFVVPETVRSVDRVFTGSLPDDGTTPPQTGGPAVNGFLVTAQDLAQPELLASGRGDRDVTWHVGSSDTVFWDPVVLTTYTVGTDDFNAWGHRFFSQSTDVNGADRLGKIFAHSNLQFSFTWSAFNPSTFQLDTNLDSGREIEVTFLLYPNPNWSRLAAGDNNDVF